MTDGYYCGDHIKRYINVEAQGCTPGANILLYVNFTLLKTKRKVKHVLEDIESVSRRDGI